MKRPPMFQLRFMQEGQEFYDNIILAIALSKNY